MRYGKLAAIGVAALVLSCSIARADQGPTTAGALAFEQNLAKAYVANDAGAMASLLASDWVVISAFGDMADRAGVLDAIGKKQWIHTKMVISEPRVKIYGNTGVVTYRLDNAGIFGGKPFHVQERETDVLLWDGSAWKAVLSHESFIKH